MTITEVSTRDRILDVAANLFIERGFAESPLSAIAQEVGITKASLYYHFPSKDSILLALVSPMLERIDALLDAAPENYADFEDRWAFVQAYIAVLRDEERGARVLSRRPWEQDGIGIDESIRRHRDRTVALATPPGASDEDRVRALLGMDIIHRELVFTPDRMVLSDIDPDERQQHVQTIVRRLLQPFGTN